ncbi:HS12B-like protein, partial [Mya arenaria]
SGIGKRNLVLASEPEAAAIYCLNLSSEQKSAMHDAFMPGRRFLTVDLGGRTADISAIEVLGDGSLKELCNVQGQLIGGQNVNEAFLQSCIENFEGDVWKKCFMDANPQELLKMEHEFEQMKVAIGNESPVDELITVSLPNTVREGITTKSIKLSPKQDKGFEAKYNKLQFRSQYIRDSLFQQTCHLVFDTVDRVLQQKESSGIQAVVLVGGFAESSIVQENVRHMIQEKYSNVKVVAPPTPFKAVLMGAVMYGHDMFIYKSRISRATYGVGCNSIVDERKHDQSMKLYNKEDGQYRCKDGDSMFLEDKSPISRTVPIFKSTKSVPEYETSSQYNVSKSLEVSSENGEEASSRHIDKCGNNGSSNLSSTECQCSVELINLQKDLLVESRTRNELLREISGSLKSLASQRDQDILNKILH